MRMMRIPHLLNESTIEMHNDEINERLKRYINKILKIKEHNDKN